jgi:uncharacterized protein DUF3221
MIRRRSDSSPATGLTKAWLRRWLVPVAALAMVSSAAAPALAQTTDGPAIRGLVTELSRSAEVVLVEENPSEESGSAKGEFAVTDETEILEQKGGDQAPASFEDLRVGQMVEATYAGPVAESYPTQGIAAKIVILDENRTDHPDNGGLAALPDTGGASVLVFGALLIAGGLVVRRLAGYSFR